MYMRLTPSEKIYLAPSKIENAGRGVFAERPIKKDELIERCPVVLVRENELEQLRQTELLNYYFMWGEDEVRHKAAICLGFGSLYNHSYSPNATYKKRLDEDVIDFIALSDISLNEEITVNYNHGDPNDKSPLWITSIPQTE